MKNFIRKILRESDFDWADSTASENAVERINWHTIVREYYLGKERTTEIDHEGDEVEVDVDEWRVLTDKEMEHREDLVFHHNVTALRNIKYEGGRIIMWVDGWNDLLPLFEDCDSYGGYVCRNTAEQVLNNEDYWEPYSDVVHDWYNQVWEIVDEKLLDEILSWTQNHLGGETIILNGEEHLIDSKMITYLQTNSDDFGTLINENDVFDDLRSEMSWAYESAYNTAARDEYWNATHNAITRLLGESKWESYEQKNSVGVFTRHRLTFDITDIFGDVMETFYTKWSEIEDEHYFTFVDDDYSYFEEVLGHIMEESLNGDYEPLNPSVQEWPDDDKVVEYFNEDMFQRI